MRKRETAELRFLNKHIARARYSLENKITIEKYNTERKVYF